MMVFLPEGRTVLGILTKVNGKFLKKYALLSNKWHPVSKETLCFTADPKEAGIWKSVLFD